jgi:Spy/CpxP family protein refolding chaperone
MNRVRIVVMGTMLMLALTTAAQQATSGGGAQGESGGGSAVDKHMAMLTEKLDLNSDQQAKVKPILQKMHDCTEKSLEDESISLDERRDNAKACRYKADREARKILSDEQKKKLDQLEEEMHPGMQGKS